MSWSHPRTLAEPRTVSSSRQSTVRDSLRRQVGNLPIRVPATDWPAIVTGAKEMFRSYATSTRGTNRTAPLVAPDTPCPRPCLLFTARHTGPNSARQWEAVPGILLEHRQEPLGAISGEDLIAEGFEYLGAFRWYWRKRHQKVGWKPWELVSVLRVRPLDDDEMFVRHWLFNELYGDWLPE